jgi:Complex1_LYR-like
VGGAIKKNSLSADAQKVSMRVSSKFLAQVSPTALKPIPENVRILAPLQLYRRLLRSHRKYLPPAPRALGDGYVKAEFRRTKDVDNPVHIIGFLTQWQVIRSEVSIDVKGILSAGGRGGMEGSQGHY